MKNNEYPYLEWYTPCMDISALNTTNDIEKLRAMALTMVQKVMSENAEKSGNYWRKAGASSFWKKC